MEPPAPKTPASVEEVRLRAKAASHEAHFCRRAHERFGVVISPEAYALLIRRVIDDAPGTKLLGYSGPRRSVWRIRAAGVLMRVVFDHDTGRLVTCMPHHAGEPRVSRRIVTDAQHRRRRLRQEGRRWR